MRRAARLLLIVLVLTIPAPALAGEVRLSAAASLTEAMKEIAVVFAAGRPGTTVVPNFGSSGTLAKQIAQGAPADIFLSANRQWVDSLIEERRLAAANVRDLAGNALVFVGRKGRNISSLRDLTDLRLIAIGSPRSVPAGQYAEEALTRAGVYRQLAEGGKLVLAQDARQALIYADRGEVDGAFSYRTDALLAREAVILFEVPAAFHSPIAYPMGLTTAGEKNPEAVALFGFLQGPAAKKILERYGFLVK